MKRVWLILLIPTFQCSITKVHIAIIGNNPGIEIQSHEQYSDQPAAEAENPGKPCTQRNPQLTTDHVDKLISLHLNKTPLP